MTEAVTVEICSKEVKPNINELKLVITYMYKHIQYIHLLFHIISTLNFLEAGTSTEKKRQLGPTLPDILFRITTRLLSSCRWYTSMVPLTDVGNT